MFRSYDYSNSVALDGNPEPDLVHATGCKQPSLRNVRFTREKSGLFFISLLPELVGFKVKSSTFFVPIRADLGCNDTMCMLTSRESLRD
jgi:hypothetical protein